MGLATSRTHRRGTRRVDACRVNGAASAPGGASALHHILQHQHLVDDRLVRHPVQLLSAQPLRQRHGHRRLVRGKRRRLGRQQRPRSARDGEAPGEPAAPKQTVRAPPSQLHRQPLPCMRERCDGGVSFRLHPDELLLMHTECSEHRSGLTVEPCLERDVLPPVRLQWEKAHSARGCAHEML
eukprot:3574767-Prymnesium_polylepis.1